MFREASRSNMKKREKLPELKEDHKSALAILASRKEFGALVKLVTIEEHNIVIQTFKIPSSDPDLARKKAWHEGRLYELRKLMKTFSEVKKDNE